jgi:hypothetical protein
MTRRSSWLAIALVSTACSKTYIIEPATGGSVGTASTTGITMTAEPNAWSGRPSDLDDYLTPLWIGIVNQRGEDVRVSYADFALTDDSGFRYAAISPYTGQAAAAPPANAPPPPAKPPPAKPAPPSAAPPPAAAPPPDETDGGWSEMRLLPGEGPLTASFELTRYGGHVGGRVYVGPHPGHGFYVHPHYHGYFHYYTPWPYSYYWPPYYGAYVYYWNYHYYPAPPSYDVMRLGLPEGVVKSGGSVSGFVYFQKAANRPKNLKLTWAISTADGKAIASLAVPFVIVED